MTTWFLSGSMGGQMFGTGGNNISGLSGDNGSIGVGNETGNTVGVSGSVGNGGNGGGDTVGGEVGSLGGLDLGGIDGGDGTVSVGNESTLVGIGVGTVDTGVVSVVSVVESVVVSVVSVVEAGGVSVSTLGGEVGSLGSLDLGGLSGGNSTVGVGDELSRGSSHASEKNLKNKQKNGKILKRFSIKTKNLPRTSCLNCKCASVQTELT